mgnify:FL=1
MVLSLWGISSINNISHARHRWSVAFGRAHAMFVYVLGRWLVMMQAIGRYTIQIYECMSLYIVWWQRNDIVHEETRTCLHSIRLENRSTPSKICSPWKLVIVGRFFIGALFFILIKRCKSHAQQSALHRPWPQLPNQPYLWFRWN